MDRNSIIGFLLLIALLIGYVTYNQHEQKVYTQQKTADSLAYAKAHPHTVIDSSKATKTVAATDSVSDSLVRKGMPPAYAGKAETVTLENKKLALTFTTKGAYPVSAQIKGYHTYYDKPLYLFNGKGNELSTILPVNNGGVATTDLYFSPVIKDEPNGDKSIDFSADLGKGKKVDIIYTLPADDYMMKCSIHMTGMPANDITLNWQTNGLHTERDVTLERMYTQVYYRHMNKSQDYERISDKKQKIDNQVEWVGLRKQYFNSILVNKDGFTNVSFTLNDNKEDTVVTATDKTIMTVPLKASNDETVSLQWYIGPNDYKILRSYDMGFKEMVQLGSGPFAFVKYLSRWTLVPIFFFLTGFISNYGLIIILMTVMIRLILSFFTYKSYMSGAKMRVLKPELDELRKECGDDQQKYSMEQMKLYRKAGVNPLGGCLPMLFQLPIFLALYYMIPSMIEFRQQSFLWVKDLSSYDSIAHLPFNIPFYGDHVSLFTLLMTASSILLAVYSRSMTGQDMNNPNMAMMKYMPYVMPILFLGIFNKYAAALTFYYFVSNTISLGIQFAIQKFFIDEKAIHAKLQENKNKKSEPSKWSQRMEQFQQAQAEKVKQQKGIKK